MDEQTLTKIEKFIDNCMERKIAEEKILESLKKLRLDEKNIHQLYRKVEIERFFKYGEEADTKKEKLEEAKKKYGGEHLIKVESIMTSPVLSAKKEDSLINTTKIMSERNISAVVVLDKGVPVGILSERDIVKKIISQSVDYKNLKVSDVMCENFIYGTTEETLLDIGTKMKMNKIKRIPIMKNGELVGIITSTDIIRIMAII